MTTKSIDLVNKIASYLNGCARGGIYNHEDAYARGVPIAYDGDTPIARIPLSEADRRIADMKDDADHVREKVQVRFGLTPYAAWSSSRRSERLEEFYDTTPAANRGARHHHPPLTRGDGDELARAAARALLDGPAVSPPPTYDYTRLLYSRSISLPAGNVGTVTEVHRRIIQSHVKGLDKFVIHQAEHWNTTITNDVKGLGGVKTINRRVRPDDHNGIKGELLDLEIGFAPLDPDDKPRELTWLRSRTLEVDWLPKTNDFVWSYVPDRPTHEAVIEVTFGAEAAPRHAMSFEDVYERDQLSNDIGLTPIPIKDGAVRYAWPNPPVGRACGIRVYW